MSDLEQIRPEAILGRRAPEVEPELAAARAAWAEIVGQDAAPFSHPARVSGDALVVVCSSATWAGELAMLRRDMEARLVAVAERPLILRFEVGDVPQAPTS
jgi:predicted nucleic acid-binding Zn ribbon protein